MKVVNKSVKDLKMYENNPRNNDQAVEEVAKSIQEFGFKVPMVIDTNNVIVCGHTRYKACLRLGITSVPCVVADDLTPDQIKAFRLVENKTNELAEWDLTKLSEELDGIQHDLDAFDFNTISEWFDDRKRWDDGRQEGNEQYNEFLDKFEQPKTTDDCYTPDEIYEAVVEYVEDRYKVDRKKFRRPFYPGGDYQNEVYRKGEIVVDNPPFSILAEIIQFYNDRGIPFFLFCPGLMGFSKGQTTNACTITVGSTITYENGAIISTNFVTNMEKDGSVAFTDPKLYKTITEISDRLRKEQTREVPKYEYPDEVMSVARMNYLSKWGQVFKIHREEFERISKLDAQGDSGIFGGGMLISQRKANEYREKKAKAEANKDKALKKRIDDLQKEGNAVAKDGAIVWGLSDREKEIVRRLK